MGTEQEWLKLMDSSFPVETADRFAEIEFVPNGSAVRDDTLRAVIRLIIYEADGDNRMIRDIKEQQVAAGAASNLEDLDRYAEFLRALQTVFGDLSSDAMSAAMPMDVFPADVLALKGTTYDDFGRALTAKSRLGQFL